MRSDEALELRQKQLSALLRLQEALQLACAGMESSTSRPDCETLRPVIQQLILDVTGN